MEKSLKHRIARYKSLYGIKGDLKPGDLLNRSKDGIKREVVKKSKKRVLGQADVAKKTVSINKKAHGKDKKRPDNRIINTIIHEELHLKHPNKNEKTVYKEANKIEKKMKPTQKRKLYSKYK